MPLASMSIVIGCGGVLVVQGRKCRRVAAFEWMADSGCAGRGSCGGHQDGESSASARYEAKAQRGQRGVERLRGEGGNRSLVVSALLLATSRGADLNRLTQGCDGGVRYLRYYLPGSTNLGTGGVWVANTEYVRYMCCL